MTITVHIDEQLLEEALAFDEQSTPDEIIAEALQEFIRSRQQSRVLELFHSIEYDSDFDYKQQRLQQ